MNEKLQSSIINVFQKSDKRIVFWYDEKKEFTEDFNELELPGIIKWEVKNNEFNLKYKIFIEDTKSRFLLYCPFPRKRMADNWLLDVELSSAEFSTDIASQYAEECGIPFEYLETVKAHVAFFSISQRRNELSKLLRFKQISDSVLNRCMLAVITKQKKPDFTIADILTSLLNHMLNADDSIMKLIDECGLTEFLWNEIRVKFSYKNDTPTLKDLALLLLKTDFYFNINAEEVKLSNDARNYVAALKDSKSIGDFFERLSSYVEDILKIDDEIKDYKLEQLIETDTFKSIERVIIASLTSEIKGNREYFSHVADIISTREKSYWYPKYKQIYEALYQAAKFNKLISGFSNSMTNASAGISNYTSSWYEIDQTYRKFLAAVDSDNTAYAPLDEIRTSIEGKYINKFLIPVNENWDNFAFSAATTGYLGNNIIRQREFFKEKVYPVIKNGINKLTVIISDALRYEVGKDLSDTIALKDKMTSEISAMVASAPTYTQLGMAALLPNNSFLLKENSTVFVDGLSSVGLENRAKILASALAELNPDLKSSVFAASQVEDMQTDKIKDLVRDNNVLFIYHNLIDDDEGKNTPTVCKNTVERLSALVTKLTSGNAYNIIITADHGFLYQHGQLDTNEYASTGYPAASSVTYDDRRFLIGYGISEDSGFSVKKASDYDLVSDDDNLEIAIPNNVLRFRKKGNDGRYAHGGLSLQEMIVPVITIKKGRKSDIRDVEIIFQPRTTTITTGTVEVVAIQKEPVSGKTQPVEAVIGIYADDNTPLSQETTVIFNSSDEDERNRRQTLTFYLNNESNEYNNTDVYFRAKAKIAGTDQKVELDSQILRLKKGSIYDEFDF
jgi:uncharacterized protein (TIGR02687 family)